MFNWRDLQYVMYTGWKSLAGEICYIHVHKVEKFNWRALRYFMSTNRAK